MNTIPAAIPGSRPLRRPGPESVFVFVLLPFLT